MCVCSCVSVAGFSINNQQSIIISMKRWMMIQIHRRHRTRIPLTRTHTRSMRSPRKPVTCPGLLFNCRAQPREARFVDLFELKVGHSGTYFHFRTRHLVTCFVLFVWEPVMSCSHPTLDFPRPLSFLGPLLLDVDDVAGGGSRPPP